MKKSIGALLITLLVGTTLAGCNNQAEEPKQQEQPSATTPTETKPEENKGDTPEAAPSQESTEASHQELRDAYELGGTIAVTPMMLTAIAMGKVENLELDQKASLALAKSISSAMTAAGWQQGDLPPGIFLSKDGTSFAVGHKTKTGDLVLHTYELQADGTTWKNVNKET